MNKPNPQLILASNSAIRKKILLGAGLRFAVDAQEIDEGVIKTAGIKEGKTAEEIAQDLALAKTAHVSNLTGKAVIGADQLLEMDGRLFDKPKNMREARARLLSMRGRKHRLVGAVVVVQKNHAAWTHVSTTHLYVRVFSEQFLDTYLLEEGEKVLASVGGYMFERRGAQLFEWVKGDFFSILGLPLLPLLSHLRSIGVATT